MSDGDEAAVRRWLDDGSEEAFRHLYREHTPYLYAFALRLAGGRADAAEEAVQEAWVRAARRLDRFRGGSKLRTWLAGIVFNCCREQRRERPTEELPESGTAAITESPADDARLDAERLLAALPAAHREVLLLHHFEGFTHQEIADLLGIPTGTSKRRLFDARNALRRLAHGAGGEGETP